MDILIISLRMAVRSSEIGLPVSKSLAVTELAAWERGVINPLGVGVPGSEIFPPCPSPRGFQPSGSLKPSLAVGIGLAKRFDFGSLCGVAVEKAGGTRAP